MKNHKVNNENPFDKEIECEISLDILSVISELSKTSLRMYVYLAKYSYKRDGVVFIDKKELKFELGFKENKSIYNGLSELLNRDILAASNDKDVYFYNPQYIAYDI